MLYLASQSPRRRELLDQLGIDYGVLDVSVPEQRQTGELPEDYVSRVAREKATAGLLKIASVPDAIVLGADTEVVLGDRVYGKPENAADAQQMLRELSSRTHQVVTVVWLMDANREARAICCSEVKFMKLNDEQIATYVATGECFGKAGAYAIQGRAAAFIEHLVGSYSGVMGLPLFETASLLRRFSLLV